MGEGNGFRVIQARHIYCALYFSSDAVADLTRGIGLWPRGFLLPDDVRLVLFRLFQLLTVLQVGERF